MFKRSYKIEVVTIATIIALAVIVKYLSSISKVALKKECLIELNRRVSGKVDQAYYNDDFNVKAFVIFLRMVTNMSHQFS